MKITMTPDEQYEQELKAILKLIKLQYLATPTNLPERKHMVMTGIGYIEPQGTEFRLEPGNNFKLRRGIVFQLQERGAIKILQPEYDDLSWDGELIGEQFIVKVLQPKFDKEYQKCEKVKLSFEDDKFLQPYTEVKKGWGYLKFNKHAKPIKIGKETNQPFRLLQFLTAPFGVARSVASVFDCIRENINSKSKRNYSVAPDGDQILKLIKYAIKEAQKGNKLQGRLRFKFDPQEKNLKLELID
jgi:hypothetical protein